MALGLLLPSPALARQSAPRTTEFRRHKEAGFAAFERGGYSDAIVSFSRAYVVKRDPRLLYNLGLAYLKRHEHGSDPKDLRKARDMFNNFLQLVRPAAYPKDRVRVKKARSLAKTYLRSIERQVARLDPPKRESPVVPEPSAESQEDEPLEDDRQVHWVLYSVAVAFGVATVITGGFSLEASGQAKDFAESHEGDANHAAADRADRLALTTDVLMGAGLAALVAAVAIHLWPRSPRETAARAMPLRVGRSGLSLQLEF